MASSLYAENIELCYGSTPALKDVTFNVDGGEFVSVIGPSGSGKTSLLHVIAGIRPPSLGRIKIGGRDVTLEPIYNRNIGMVFQGYALFPHLTAYANVEFPLRAGQHKTDIKTARSKVENMFALLGLEGLEHRMPKELSGGQQQRVALARALVFDPEILLLDEPLTALDRNLRSQLQLEIASLQKRLGITTIFVTHDVAEAMVMSQRIIVLREGAIEAVGTPKEIYEEPPNLFVARLVGDVNIIEGAVLQFSSENIYLDIDHANEVLVPSRGSVGENIRISAGVRPEKIRLQAFAPREDGWNRLPAELVRHSYLGPAVKLYFRVAGIFEWQTLVSMEEGSYLAGIADLEVTWKVEDTRILR